MKIERPALRKEIGSAPRCESCRRAVALQVHHLRRKGFGSGFWVDARINLAALCTDCHQADHAGKLFDVEGRSLVRLAVAKREGTTYEATLEVIDLINRLDSKRAGLWSMSGQPLAQELSWLSEEGRALAERTLAEAGVKLEAA